MVTSYGFKHRWVERQLPLPLPFTLLSSDTVLNKILLAGWMIFVQISLQSSLEKSNIGVGASVLSFMEGLI